ncbi:MAG TPA: nucleotidyltransferase family protein [Vicinamibacterales bacterium]|nr:nucleotidyltransferase family protein [Vicinamibacterales bacterium]
MTLTDSSEIEHQLCQLLATLEAATDGMIPSPGDQARLVAAARGHRVAPLLAFQLRRDGRLQGWMPSIRETLLAVWRDAVVLEEVRRPELERLLARLAAAGCPVLLFKGAALAYLVYPEPALRPRLDADLLVREADVPRVRRVLEEAGYAAPNEVSGALVTRQCHYDRTDRHGIRHALDIHWRPLNVPRFADVLGFDEIAASAVRVPALSPHALAPAPGHHLLIACLHRLAHHPDADDLLWLWDLHLLTVSLGEAGLRDFAALAAERRVLSIGLHELDAVHARFPTTLVAALLARSPDARALAEREGTLEYLNGGRRLVDALRRDLDAMRGWRERLALLRQHLFPSPEYVRRRYGRTGGAVLPLLYAYRWCRGVPRWFRR